MNNLKVIFKGKVYIILHQHSSGYCEISEEGSSIGEVQLVHFSELTLVI
ncbi:hypothetical protein V7124_16495 [Neobacillus niacini]